MLTSLFTVFQYFPVKQRTHNSSQCLIYSWRENKMVEWMYLIVIQLSPGFRSNVPAVLGVGVSVPSTKIIQKEWQNHVDNSFLYTVNHFIFAWSLFLLKHAAVFICSQWKNCFVYVLCYGKKTFHIFIVVMQSIREKYRKLEYCEQYRIYCTPRPFRNII